MSLSTKKRARRIRRAWAAWYTKNNDAIHNACEWFMDRAIRYASEQRRPLVEFTIPMANGVYGAIQWTELLRKAAP